MSKFNLSDELLTAEQSDKLKEWNAFAAKDALLHKHVFERAGVLIVYMKAASNLRDADAGLFSGQSDPFVVVTVPSGAPQPHRAQSGSSDPGGSVEILTRNPFKLANSISMNNRYNTCRASFEEKVIYIVSARCAAT